MCYKLFGKCTFSGTCRSVHCKNLVKHEDVRRSNPGQKSRSQEAWGCLVHLSMEDGISSSLLFSIHFVGRNYLLSKGSLYGEVHEGPIPIHPL